MQASIRRTAGRALTPAALALAVVAAPGTAQRAAVPAARTPDVAALDAYFAKAREDWGVPGMAVAIVKDGKVVLAKGYGVRELGKPDPVDEHTLFAIASNTKAFTATALATLVDEGKLSWDDRVQKHLPWFQLYDPFVSQDIRVRDLLSHRSGLGTFSGDLLWYGTTYSPEEIARRIRYLEPAGQYRGSYGYSNVAFVTAGLLIPTLTARSWIDYVSARILRPIGMTETVASVDSLPRRRDVATPHARWRGQTIPIPWYDWDNMVAAGGIISSAHDMARWLELLLGGGERDGVRVVSAERLRELWTPQISFEVSAASERRFPSTHFRGYGMAFTLNDYLGRKIVGHTGGYDGMYSRVVLVPEERLGMVVLTNSTTNISTPLVYRVLDAYLGGPERDWSTEMLAEARAADSAEAARRDSIVGKPAPGAKPTLPLQAYAGTYTSDLYGDATVAVENGRLVLRLLPNPDLVADLRPRGGDAFILEWRRRFPFFDRGVATFVPNDVGTPTELRLNVPNQDFWFEELKLRRK
ncbi:MAG: serine hydrolase [Gemmatimonadetes bacterium]|nr:serine hydrolase [Gemmatimonadota bacterium]